MKLIFLFLLLASFQAPASPLLHQASFTENWSRYPSPDSIVATLAQQFPHFNLKEGISRCISVTPDNQMLLGESSPLSGAPYIKDPNSAFIVWYTGCVQTFAQGEARAYQNAMTAKPANMTRDEAAKDFFGPQILGLCTELDERTNNCDWAKLAKPKRVDALVEVIEMLIGPNDVIRDEGIAPSSEDFAQRIDDALTGAITNKPSQFTFLNLNLASSYDRTPIRLMPAIQFMILLNDTLKY